MLKLLPVGTKVKVDGMSATVIAIMIEEKEVVSYRIFRPNGTAEAVVQWVPSFLLDKPVETQQIGFKQGGVNG